LGLSVDAMRETRNGARAGRGLAVAGLILSILGVISVAFIYLVILQQGHDLSNQFNQMNSELSTPGVSP
jgi:predicted PurR-regulated permease PerM